ncbi:MAG: IS200/IS605 family transposase [Bacteroidetes bacterium]|nr:MAG: IS200/IS605 family transposase [Bacteroidota bacterium]
MPFVKIWIHLIWSTKNRDPLLPKEIREKVFEHIKENAKDKSIYIDTIGGHIDHVHTLISLKGDQSISKVAMLLKGESSHWVNKNNLTRMKFEWQDEYIAVSVSESIVDKVRAYINNQEEHHRKKSFKEECDEFMKKYGFEVLG